MQSVTGKSNKKMRRVPCAYNFNQTKNHITNTF